MGDSAGGLKTPNTHKTQPGLAAQYRERDRQDDTPLALGLVQEDKG